MNDRNRLRRHIRNADFVRDRRERRQHGNPIGGTPRRSNSTSAAYRIASLVCAALLVCTGVYLAIAVIRSNGFRSHWRIVLVTQFAEALFGVLQSEQTHWQGE